MYMMDEACAGDVDADAHDLEAEEGILGLEAVEGVDVLGRTVLMASLCSFNFKKSRQ